MSWSFSQSVRNSLALENDCISQRCMSVCLDGCVEKFKGYLLFRVILFPIQDHLGAAEFCPANKIVQQNENKNNNLTKKKTTKMKKRN